MRMRRPLRLLVPFSGRRQATLAIALLLTPLRSEVICLQDAATILALLEPRAHKIRSRAAQMPLLVSA